MQKVGSTTDTADANGEWTNGNVAQGVSPTVINAAILNTHQRELVNIVEGVGMQLNPNDDGQISEAIFKMIANKSSALLQPRGYQQFPSGLIIQWGREYSSSTSVEIQYPIKYSTSVFFVSAVKITSEDGRFATVGEPNETSFTAYGRLLSNPAAIDNFFWFSIGF